MVALLGKMFFVFINSNPSQKRMPDPFQPALAILHVVRRRYRRGDPGRRPHDGDATVHARSVPAPLPVPSRVGSRQILRRGHADAARI